MPGVGGLRVHVSLRSFGPGSGFSAALASGSLLVARGMVLRKAVLSTLTATGELSPVFMYKPFTVDPFTGNAEFIIDEFTVDQWMAAYLDTLPGQGGMVVSIPGPQRFFDVQPMSSVGSFQFDEVTGFTVFLRPLVAWDGGTLAYVSSGTLVPTVNEIMMAAPPPS